MLLLGLTGSILGGSVGCANVTGKVGFGLGPVEVECGGGIGARRRLGGVEGADPHAPPLSQSSSSGACCCCRHHLERVAHQAVGQRVAGGVGGRQHGQIGSTSEDAMAKSAALGRTRSRGAHTGPT
jgi:hypothetical protein